MTHFMYSAVALIGSITTVYFGVRLGATIVDIYQRWRANDWSIDAD